VVLLRLNFFEHHLFLRQPTELELFFTVSFSQRKTLRWKSVF